MSANTDRETFHKAVVFLFNQTYYIIAVGTTEFLTGRIDNQIHVFQGYRSQQYFLRAGQKQGAARRITILPVYSYRLRYPTYLAQAVGQVRVAQSLYLEVQLPLNILIDNQGPRAGIHQRPYRALPDIILRSMSPLRVTHIGSVFQDNFRINCSHILLLTLW
jgi:hypothetical protein